MAINQISTQNTFGEWVAATTNLITISNNLTDNVLSSNAKITLTRPGFSLNVTNSAFINSLTANTITIPTTGNLIVSGNTTLTYANVTQTLTVNNFVVIGTYTLGSASYNNIDASGYVNAASYLKSTNYLSVGTFINQSGANNTFAGQTAFTNATTSITTLGNVSFGKSVTVAENLTVTKESILSGNLTVSKNATVTGILAVTGNTNLSGNLSVSKNATVTGNTNLSGNLSVTKDTTLSGILAVTGNTNLSGNLSVVGSITSSGSQVITVNTLSKQNKIINGGMTIDQRYLFAGAIPTTGTYMIDRWIFQSSGVGSVYVNSNDLNSLGFGYPASNITNALNLLVNAADTSLTGNDYYAFGQRIEGYDTLDLMDQTFTLGFWVLASRSGTYYVSFRNKDATASYVTPYTINAIDTWEYKTITVSGGLYSTGYNWEKSNLQGVGVLWLLGLSSTATFTTSSTNTWLSGNYIGTSSQTNLMQTTSDYFVITNVQLQVGSVLPRWESRSYSEELAMCQRYYQKSYAPSVIPGTISSTQRVINWSGGLHHAK
jgi:predicted acyltransferase (DUF342 family)